MRGSSDDQCGSTFAFNRRRSLIELATSTSLSSWSMKLLWNLSGSLAFWSVALVLAAAGFPRTPALATAATPTSRPAPTPTCLSVAPPVAELALQPEMERVEIGQEVAVSARMLSTYPLYGFELEGADPWLGFVDGSRADGDPANGYRLVGIAPGTAMLRLRATIQYSTGCFGDPPATMTFWSDRVLLEVVAAPTPTTTPLATTSGPYLYVADPETSSIVLLDPATGGVLRRVEVGDPEIFGPCGVLGAGDKLFVAADCGGSEIVVLDAGSLEQEAEINVGCCTTGQMTVSTDGSELYVITEDLGDAYAAVVSTSDYSLVRVLRLENVPRSISFGAGTPASASPDPDGCQLDADRGSGGHGIAWIMVMFALLRLLAQGKPESNESHSDRRDLHG